MSGETKERLKAERKKREMKQGFDDVIAKVKGCGIKKIAVAAKWLPLRKRRHRPN